MYKALAPSLLILKLSASIKFLSKDISVTGEVTQPKIASYLNQYVNGLILFRGAKGRLNHGKNTTDYLKFYPSAFRASIFAKQTTRQQGLQTKLVTRRKMSCHLTVAKVFVHHTASMILCKEEVHIMSEIFAEPFWLGFLAYTMSLE